MFRNYLIVAIRNLLKKKFYSFINILGLTAGITATLFIILYISGELSYDRFHTKIDRMYRVALHAKLGGQDLTGNYTPAPMAAALVSDIPEIEESIRMWVFTNVVIKYNDKSFTENGILLTDSNFFQFFSFKLLKGDPATVLKDPNSMVLTETSAKKLFGKEDPLGKILIFGNDNQSMKVTGVAQDPPENSHIKFQYLVSILSQGYSRNPIWLANTIQTYFIIHKDADIEATKKKVSGLIPKYIGPEMQQFLGVSMDQFMKNGGEYGYLVDPVKDIHLYSKISGDYDPSGDINYIYIFSAIGIFILLIASINFMNLTTARSSSRAREVGMRKTFGSLNRQLILQFLMESFIFSLISVVLAFILSIVLLPQYNMLAGKNLHWISLFNPLYLGGAVILILIVGLFAGSYPAFFLTRFGITEVFKGSAAKGSKSGWIRGTLVTLQFSLSIMLIICTSIVYNQMQYTQNKDLGLDRKKALVLMNADRLNNNRTAFKNDLMKQSGIVAASYSVSTFPGVNSTTVYRKPGNDEDHLVGEYYADYDQVKAMGYSIAEGRGFSRDFPSDSVGVMVNETLVREMGWEHPVGEKLISYNGQTPEEVTVVGVLKDFNFESLKGKIRPLVIRLGANFGNYMTIRYSGNNAREVVNLVENKWKEFTSGEPFQFSFLDDNFNAQYTTDIKVGQLLGVFAALAIFIACLGLFGLAAYTAEQRTKEIGIRKAMGASSFIIIRMLSTEFMKFIIIAFFIAIVPAWFFISKWLLNFAYHVEINYIIFILSGLAALIIALLTVSYQSVKASGLNPAQTLRYE